MIMMLVTVVVFLWALENTCEGMRRVQEKNRAKRANRT